MVADAVQGGEEMSIHELIEQLKAMPEKIEGFNSEGELVVLNTHKLAESLKKSLRNCDVGTSEEQAERFYAFCGYHRFQSGIKGMCSSLCPCIRCRDMCNCITTWSQMPYDEGGAK